MKYWIARLLIFFAICLLWLSGLLGVFKGRHAEVLHGAGDLRTLQDMIKRHTNGMVKDLFHSINQRMPWNR